MTQDDRDMRMRILLAAKTLFARQGYADTKVRQICEEAGANVALVSYYFNGKEGLFNELFRTFFPSRDIEGLRKGLSDAKKDLETLICEVIRYRYLEPELMVIVEQEIILNSPRLDVIRQNVFPTWELLREILERGREQGVFRFDDLDITMMFVIGTLLFPKRWNYFRPMLANDEPDWERLARETFAFVSRAIQP